MADAEAEEDAVRLDARTHVAASLNAFSCACNARQPR
jgi:hypothetical protein